MCTIVMNCSRIFASSGEVVGHKCLVSDYDCHGLGRSLRWSVLKLSKFE